MEFLTKEEIKNGSGFASQDLRNQVLDSSEDKFFHVAFTDYGGSIIDKMYFEYFQKNFPENIIFEYTGWNGANGFIHCKNLHITIEEFQDRFDSYLLFFEDIEEYFSQQELEEKQKACLDFLKWENLEYKEDNLQSILEVFENHSQLLTFGVDYSSDRIEDELLRENLVSKESE